MSDLTLMLGESLMEPCSHHFNGLLLSPLECEALSVKAKWSELVRIPIL